MVSPRALAGARPSAGSFSPGWWRSRRLTGPGFGSRMSPRLARQETGAALIGDSGHVVGGVALREPAAPGHCVGRDLPGERGILDLRRPDAGPARSHGGGGGRRPPLRHWRLLRRFHPAHRRLDLRAASDGRRARRFRPRAAPPGRWNIRGTPSLRRDFTFRIRHPLHVECDDPVENEWSQEPTCPRRASI